MCANFYYKQHITVHFRVIIGYNQDMTRAGVSENFVACTYFHTKSRARM